MYSDNTAMKTNNWEANFQQRSIWGNCLVVPLEMGNPQAEKVYTLPAASTQYFRRMWSQVIADDLFLQIQCIFGGLKQLQTKNSVHKPSGSPNNRGSLSLWWREPGKVPTGLFLFSRFS